VVVDVDYFIIIWTVIVFFENRILERIDYSELERATGFSLQHIRDVFARKTGVSLAKYVLTRKIANAAFEILYSDQTILDIAEKYSFSNHDTFTRAFKRVTGMTPADFRKKRPPVGRIKLCSGVYGVGFLNEVRKEEDES
jgi:AraC family transcriptional regulator